MTRAYVRVDPAFYERKLQQGYPVGAIGALIGCICMAEVQTQRGRFRDVIVLKALLGKDGGKWVPLLVERGDLTVEPNGRVYVDGWDEWQEGDWQVKERMERVRNRKRANGSEPTVTDVTPPTDTSRPGGAGRGGDKAGRPARYIGNVRKAFQDVTGRLPSQDEQKWLEELCRDLTRENVCLALYADPAPGERGILGRISRELRGKAA